jgi:hypothetical protein
MCNPKKHYGKEEGIMKKLASVFLFSIFLMANASVASAQDVNFRGTFVITKLNQACKDVGWVRGDLAPSQFVPGGVGDNAFTGLSYFFTFFAEGYHYSGPYIDLTQGDSVVVFGAGVGPSAFSFNAGLKLNSVKPGNITPNTSFLRIVGQIENFNGTSGCNITFRGSYNRRL